MITSPSNATVPLIVIGFAAVPTRITLAAVEPPLLVPNVVAVLFGVGSVVAAVELPNGTTVGLKAVSVPVAFAVVAVHSTGSMSLLPFVLGMTDGKFVGICLSTYYPNV